jgi:Flp pilus assembly protein CpaB
MFKNYKFWLAVTVMLAATTALITVSVLQKYTQSVCVVLAKANIESAQVINEKMLVSNKEFPRRGMYADTVTGPRQVQGMISKGFIPAGTVLRASMFETSQSAMMSGKLSALGKEYRAVALPKQLSTTVADTLNEGDTVDMYVRNTEKGVSVVKKMASDILVVYNKYGEQQSTGVVLAFKENELTEDLLLRFFNPGEVMFVLKRKVGQSPHA